MLVWCWKTHQTLQCIRILDLYSKSSICSACCMLYFILFFSKPTTPLQNSKLPPTTSAAQAGGTSLWSHKKKLVPSIRQPNEAKWVTDEKYRIIQQGRQAVTKVMKLVQTICLILSCFLPISHTALTISSSGTPFTQGHLGSLSKCNWGRLMCRRRWHSGRWRVLGLIPKEETIGRACKRDCPKTRFREYGPVD